MSTFADIAIGSWFSHSGLTWQKLGPHTGLAQGFEASDHFNGDEEVQTERLPEPTRMELFIGGVADGVRDSVPEKDDYRVVVARETQPPTVGPLQAPGSYFLKQTQYRRMWMGFAAGREDLSVFVAEGLDMRQAVLRLMNRYPQPKEDDR